MSKLANKSAFPVYAPPPDRNEDVFNPGATLKEYYAGLAMQAIITMGTELQADGIAKKAIEAADALINQLERE